MTNTVNQGIMYTNPTTNDYMHYFNPVGNVDRSGQALGINATDIAREDWLRNEQTAVNQFYRDLYLIENGNRYNSVEAEKNRQSNSLEAEKQRAYDREMSNTQYTRAVADMKDAGLNPVLALGAQGASFHGGSSASGSAASASNASSSSSGYKPTKYGDSLATVLSGIAGLVKKLF